MRQIFAGYVDGIDVLLEDVHSLIIHDFNNSKEFKSKSGEYCDKVQIYFDSIDKKLNELYDLNDRDGILLIKEELEKNKNTLLNLDVEKWAAEIFQNVKETSLENYSRTSVFLLGSMCDVFNNLINRNHSAMSDANYYLRNIPTTHLIDMLKRENLVEPLSHIYKKGWISTALVDESDLRKLQTLGLVLVSEGGCFTSDKADHIYNTCLNAHD